MNDVIVPDANVFLEIIYGRPLQGVARLLLTQAIKGEIRLLAPSLLLDEITEVLCGNLDNMTDIRRHLLFLEQLIHKNVLLIAVPTLAVRMKAIETARIGNPKSGYPELGDSLYHALAIINDAVFLTNDARYVAKARHLGHVKKLAEYENINAG